MSDQKPLGREAILASKFSRKSEMVEVPGLDGSIRIMLPDTRGSIFIQKYKDSENAIGAAFVAVVVDEDGKRIFDLTDDAITEVMTLGVEVVGAVANAIVSLRQNSVGDEIKNFPASPTSDLPIV